MEIDIANNIKAVELLKTELLQKVTDLYGDIASDADCESERRLVNDAADIMIMTSLLCRRLGISSASVTDAICSRLGAEIERGHILERRFGDLSAVLGELRGNIYDEKYEG